MLDELVSVLNQKIVRAAQVIIFFLRSVSYQKIIWFSDQIFGSVNNQKANIKPLERTLFFSFLNAWLPRWWPTSMVSAHLLELSAL